jgi:uncharacterized protein
VRRLLAPASTAAGLAAALHACAPAAYQAATPVAFDTAAVWIVQGTDSARLNVEVADTRHEQEVGLSGRDSLDPAWGMLFRFAETRSGDEGFWMVGTAMPLDVAFMDGAGVIRKILGMDVCHASDPVDECPGYFPGIPYVAALEVNRGWLRARNLDVGAHVRVVE